MRRPPVSRLIVFAAACLFFSAGAQAGPGLSGEKGLKIDPLLSQEIAKSATASLHQPSAPPTSGTPEIMGPPAPPNPPETKAAAPAIRLPSLPVYHEEPPEPPVKFAWPEKPGHVYNKILFLPSLLFRQGWNSNLFAADTARDSDFITEITPRLRLELPQSAHDFALEGSWEYRKHYNNPDEDQHNARATLRGDLKAANWVRVPYEASWEKIHEEREDDLLRQNPLHPLEIKNFRAESGIAFEPKGLGVSLLGRYETERFGDGHERSTLAPIIRHDADRDTLQAEFNAVLTIDAENSVATRLRKGVRDYEHLNYQAGGFTGPRRNSEQRAGMMSWIFNHGAFKGHATIGIDDWDYDSPAIGDVTEITGDFEVDHEIGPLTSVNFQLERSLYEDPEAIDPLIRSRAGFYVDHQPWEDVMIAAGTDYNYLEFNTSARDDTVWDFRMIGDYFVNDFLSFGAEYAYTTRNSEAAGLDFTRNLFMLRARGRL